MRLRGFGVGLQGFGVLGFYRFGANRMGALRRYPVVSYPPSVQAGLHSHGSVQRRGQELACDGPLENQARESERVELGKASLRLNLLLTGNGQHHDCSSMLPSFPSTLRLNIPQPYMVARIACQEALRSYLTRTTAIPMKHGGWYESCMTLSTFNRGIRLRVWKLLY